MLIGPRLAIVVRYVNGGDVVTVKVRRGWRKSYQQLLDDIDDDKIMTSDPDSEEYPYDIPSFKEMKQAIKRTRLFCFEGGHWIMDIVRAY